MLSTISGLIGLKAKIIIALTLFTFLTWQLIAFKKTYDKQVSQAAVAIYLKSQADLLAKKVAEIEHTQQANTAHIRRERDIALNLNNALKQQKAELQHALDKIGNTIEPDCHRITDNSWVQLNKTRCAYNAQRGYVDNKNPAGSCGIASRTPAIP